MNTGILQRPGRSSEALLSDQIYRGRTFARQTRQSSPAPVITIEASSSFSIPFGDEGAFVFEQEPGKWFMPLLSQICDLGLLPPNWNTYGAQPIDPDTAAFAAAILLTLLSADDPVPSIVPTSPGGILLEWHDGGIDLEVDIRSPSSVQVLFEDGAHEEEYERAELEIIQGKLNILRGRLQSADGNT